jgi:hypothetical protein
MKRNGDGGFELSTWLGATFYLFPNSNIFPADPTAWLVVENLPNFNDFNGIFTLTERGEKEPETVNSKVGI